MFGKGSFEKIVLKKQLAENGEKRRRRGEGKREGKGGIGKREMRKRTGGLKEIWASLNETKSISCKGIELRRSSILRLGSFQIACLLAPTASTPHGSLMEMLNLWPSPDLRDQNLHKIPKSFRHTLKL